MLGPVVCCLFTDVSKSCSYDSFRVSRMALRQSVTTHTAQHASTAVRPYGKAGYQYCVGYYRLSEVYLVCLKFRQPILKR
jgi:uncharacterized FlgJ-related protein